MRVERPVLESLESRRLLSAELLQSGELLIVGTSAADAITVEPGSIDGQALLFGVPGVTDGTAFDGVNSLTIRTLGGRDFVDVLSGLRDAQSNAVDATILGGPGQDRLKGGDGDDTINGGGARDIIRGRDGNDVIKGNAGNDNLFGGAGNDRLVGGGGNEILRGDDGDDRLLGNTGDDNADGGLGNDRIVGGAGSDLLVGGDGDDEIEGKAGNDRLFGNAGNDLLKGLNGADLLFGGDGDDELRGNAGNDDLHGGTGIDVLLGGAGDDLLTSGTGVDTVTGGRGTDSFRTPFSERQDFGALDRFFTDDAGRGEDYAVLGDDIWAEVDRLDALGLITNQMWLGLDAAQLLLAECGVHEDTLERLGDELSDDEEAALDSQVFTIVIGFLFDVGADLENLTTESIFALLDELRAIDLNGPMQDALDAFVACWRDNEPAVDAVVDAMLAFGDAGLLDPVFRNALGDLLLDLWPI